MEMFTLNEGTIFEEDKLSFLGVNIPSKNIKYIDLSLYNQDGLLMEKRKCTRGMIDTIETEFYVYETHNKIKCQSRVYRKMERGHIILIDNIMEPGNNFSFVKPSPYFPPNKMRPVEMDIYLDTPDCPAIKRLFDEDGNKILEVCGNTVKKFQYSIDMGGKTHLNRMEEKRYVTNAETGTTKLDKIFISLYAFGKKMHYVVQDAKYNNEYTEEYRYYKAGKYKIQLFKDGLLCVTKYHYYNGEEAITYVDNVYINPSWKINRNSLYINRQKIHYGKNHLVDKVENYRLYQDDIGGTIDVMEAYQKYVLSKSPTLWLDYQGSEIINFTEHRDTLFNVAASESLNYGTLAYSRHRNYLKNLENFVDHHEFKTSVCGCVLSVLLDGAEAVEQSGTIRMIIDIKDISKYSQVNILEVISRIRDLVVEDGDKGYNVDTITIINGNFSIEFCGNAELPLVRDIRYKTQTTRPRRSYEVHYYYEFDEEEGKPYYYLVYKKETCAFTYEISMEVLLQNGIDKILYKRFSDENRYSKRSRKIWEEVLGPESVWWFMHTVSEMF